MGNNNGEALTRESVEVKGGARREESFFKSDIWLHSWQILHHHVSVALPSCLISFTAYSTIMSCTSRKTNAICDLDNYFTMDTIAL